MLTFIHIIVSTWEYQGKKSQKKLKIVCVFQWLEMGLRIFHSIVWPLGCLIDWVFISEPWLRVVVGVWVMKPDGCICPKKLEISEQPPSIFLQQKRMFYTVKHMKVECRLQPPATAFWRWLLKMGKNEMGWEKRESYRGRSHSSGNASPFSYHHTQPVAGGPLHRWKLWWCWGQRLEGEAQGMNDVWWGWTNSILNRLILLQIKVL